MKLSTQSSLPHVKNPETVISEELLTQVEWRLCTEARYAFALLVGEIIKKRITLDEGKNIMQVINIFNTNPGESIREQDVYELIRGDVVRTEADFKPLENELLSDLASFEQEGKLRKGIAMSVRIALRHVKKALTKKWAQELIRAFMERKDLAADTLEVVSKIRKYSHPWKPTLAN